MAKKNPFRVKNETPALRKFERTKFYQFIVECERLAQFAPDNPDNANWCLLDLVPCDVDWTASLAEIDAQIFRLFGFTPSMIEFLEERYRYDELYDAG